MFDLANKEEMALLHRNTVDVIMMEKYGPLHMPRGDRYIAERMMTVPNSAIRSKIDELQEQIRFLEGWLKEEPAPAGPVDDD